MDNKELNDSFNRLWNKIMEDRKNHIKTRLTGRQHLVEALIDEMKIELEGEIETDYTINQESADLTIKVTGDFLLTCDEANSLNQLITLANTFKIEVIDDQAVLSLWFRYWEWIKKEA